MRKRILSACMALCLMLTMLPVNALAADPPTTGEIGKDQAAYSNGGLNITKTLTKEDGNLSLQLEAYVTGTVTPIETKPLDIVLVLDVSGSMDDGFGTSGYEYVPVDDTEWSYNDIVYSPESYYYQVGENEYRQVYGSADRDRNSRYWVYSNYRIGYYQNRSFTQISDTSEDDPDAVIYTGTLYTRTYVEADTKLEAMQEAVNGFIDSVAASNGDHRISIVKFAGNNSDSIGNDTYSSGWYRYNYSQIVRSWTDVTADNAVTLKAAVNQLRGGGATRADYGLSHAQDLLSDKDEARDSARQVVILFTDGDPTSGSSFEEDVAAAAVNTACDMKQDGVTIYTVGIFNGADPNNDPDNRRTSDSNKYMHAVSSNYPGATATGTWQGHEYDDWDDLVFGDRAENSNYYLAADSADALKDIFESIGGDITSSVDVDETAALTDALTKYFGFGDLGFDSETGTYENVSVQVASATGENQWDAPTDTSGVTVTVNGDAISVTGFDYAENAVVNNNGTWQGQKLLLTFPIEIDENADWGPSDYYDTNSAAGLKASDGTEIGMLTESPDVYVATRQVTYEFVSGTDGMDLPSAVTEQLTSATEYVPDTVQTPANSHAGDEYDLVEVTGTDNDGTWTPGTKWTGPTQDTDGNYTYTLTWTFTPDGGGTTEQTYHVGYFVIMPGMLPDNFDPSQGYDPNTYVPNSTGDYVMYGNNGNHFVNNTTGYLGDITAADAVATADNNRFEITASTEEELQALYELYLEVPTDLGQVEEYREDIVWYQINNRGLSPEWPNADTATTPVSGVTYHVDGYIPNVNIEVRYYANDGTTVDGYPYGKHVDHYLNSDGTTLQSGDSYTILSNTADELNFTRPGYEFIGWCTDPVPDDDSVWYDLDIVIDTLMNSLVLYAQWAEIVPSVDAGKDAALQDDGTIDYTITIKTGEGNQGILKNFRITDAKLPVDVEDITIRINSAIPVYQEEIRDEDGTVTTPSGDPVVADQVVNDETVRVLTFALADPLDGEDVLTITYNYEYTDEDAAGGTVTNTANVEAWNEDEEQSGSDEDTTTTPVTPGITSAEKSVVMEDTLVPQSILDKIVGEITYPIRPTDTQENPQIAAEEGAKVTLLYEIGIVGSAGADFTVKEKSGADYVGAVDSSGQPATVTFESGSAQYVGLIPEGCSYVTLYFTMTFEIGEKTTVLTNAATVNGKEVTEEVDVAKPGLYVDKTVKINGKDYEDGMVAKEDDVLTYKITVKNNSNAAITGTVTVTDDMWGTADGMIGQVQLKQQNAAGEVLLSGPADVSGGSWTIIPRGTDTQFDAGETWTFTYTYTVTAEDVIAGNVTNTVTAESGNGDESTEEVTVPAGSITITPADITIYTGGDGYSNVLDENGTPIATTAQGFPEPGYHLTLPDAVKEWLRNHGVTTDDVATNLAGILSFRYYDENGKVIRNWDLEDQGVYSKDGDVITAYVYSLSPNTAEEQRGIKVRLQVTNPDDGNSVVFDDDIDMDATLVSDQYTMKIYSGELDQSKIKAVFTVGDDSITCNVEIGTGELLVKSVTDIGTTTNAIEDNGDAVASGTLTAAADSTVHYYVNDSEVEVENEADRVQLLVDSVSNSTEFNRSMEQDAINKADAQDGVSLSNAQAESFYLDLCGHGQRQHRGDPGRRRQTDHLLALAGRC